MPVLIRNRRFAIALALALALVVVGAPALACEGLSVPPGASALGYGRIVIDLCPKVSDIAIGGRGGASALYNNVWWSKTPPVASNYSDGPNGGLRLHLGATVATVPVAMTRGLLPLLSGARGFYVEFEVRLSDNHKDHWPAVWLLPIEHNSRKDDSYPPDPLGYERWLEIDVDEGGFSPGPKGTAIAWEGIWPNYKSTQSLPNLHNTFVDRTQIHRFGAGFDPRKLEITFWFDGRVQYVAGGDSVPEISRQQNFYIIMNAQSHGANVSYTMEILRVRAFEPE